MNMPGAQPNGLHPEELLHAPRKIGARRLEEQVQVVLHENEGEQFPAAAQHRAAQVIEQPFTVVVVANDALSGVSPRHHVIDSTLKLDSRSSWHPMSGTRPALEFNEKPKTKSDTSGRLTLAWMPMQKKKPNKISHTHKDE